jgi:hypothetical protein
MAEVEVQQHLNKARLDVKKLLNKNEINGIPIMRKKHKKYTIIKYDKRQCLPSQYYRVAYMRTLIIDNELSKVVCVGPNKSIPVEEIEQYTNSDVNIHYEEFIDGVMINVFWDETDQLWQYATRSNIGADIRFFLQTESKKTFRTMFEEALNEDNVDLNMLPKTMCYSFVLQHPENRIVEPIEKPHVVLVEAHCITDTIITVYPHGTGELDCALRTIVDEYSIPIPKKYPYKTRKEAVDNHATRNTHYACMGIVMKNYSAGWRSKIRNPVYEDVKQLRGNIPKLQFLYLTLRHSGNVKNYLQYYKEHAGEFQNYRKQLHDFTHNLYVNYVDCFIKKKAHVNTYPHQYKVGMTSLHSKYLDELMPYGKHVHKGVVINYMNTLSPQQQMYLLNYNYRK